jgi:uncharacterized damage-inducible protein DinB
MDLLTHFRMLARYNRIANERLYESCAQLDEQQYRAPRDGPFGSIHGLLNHLLLGDTIWMSRFEGGGGSTPPLNTVLHESFATLRAAREQMDARIEQFFESAHDGVLNRCYAYLNNQGKSYVETAPVAMAHFFNHQTHHRGQVCVMLNAAGMRPPSMDLHRIANP